MAESESAVHNNPTVKRVYYLPNGTIVNTIIERGGYERITSVKAPDDYPLTLDKRLEKPGKGVGSGDIGERRNG